MPRHGGDRDGAASEPCGRWGGGAHACGPLSLVGSHAPSPGTTWHGGREGVALPGPWGGGGGAPATKRPQRRGGWG